MKENSKNFLSLFSVLMIILMSNTLYFGLINRKITFAVYVSIGIIYMFTYKNIRVKNLKVMLCFFSIMVINSILNFNIIDKTYIIIELQTLIILVITMIIINNMDYKVFITNYIKIMYVIAIISLVCFFIAVFEPQLAEKLSSNMGHGMRIYKVSPFYTWGWDNIFLRNSGVFWEPGAYQGFLNIAFLMILIYKKYIKNSSLKLIVFSMTIVTTQSTSGYIIFILIIIFFFKDIKKIYKRKIFNKIIVVLLIILCIFTIVKSGNISNKFNNDNGSTIIRSKDLENSLIMSKERIITGYGVGEFKNEKERQYGIQNNSNGLLYLLYSQGIVLFIYYLYRLKKGIFNVFFSFNKFKKYIIFTIFIILYITEGLGWLPFYMVFLFDMKRNGDYEENLYI